MPGESFNLSPPLVEVFIRALMLAESAGASEIEPSHLLTSLDLMAAEKQPTPAPPFEPVPAHDLPVSSEARAILDSVGVPERATLEDLRAALLAARQRTS